MSTTTMPASHFGWEGQTLEYTVKADGASEIAIPGTLPDGVRVRILDTHQTGNGLEARVVVDVTKPIFY